MPPWIITAEVKVRRVRSSDLPLPAYKTAEAAGMDLIEIIISSFNPWSASSSAPVCPSSSPGFSKANPPPLGLALKEEHHLLELARNH